MTESSPDRALVFGTAGRTVRYLSHKIPEYRDKNIKVLVVNRSLTHSLQNGSLVLHQLSYDIHWEYVMCTPYLGIYRKGERASLVLHLK